MNKNPGPDGQCHITKSIDEESKSLFSFKYLYLFFSVTNILISATGTLSRLPGNNPVQHEGKTATVNTDNAEPPLISPVYAYTGTSPSATGQIVAGQTKAPTVPKTTSTPTPPEPSSSSSNDHNVAAVIPTSSSNSDSDTHNSCGTGTTPKKRQPGLDYRRHHRRLSHVPDHDSFHDSY